ncbi:MAG: efflux RND transporter permease subunit [Nannocystaceae bacterium]
MAEHLVVRLRWLILALVVGMSAWLIPGVSDIREDNDVLAFLPPDHPDVVTFHEVAERFGMLELGLVGLAAEDGSDLLTLEHVDEVRTLAKKIGQVDGVRVVLSFADLPNPVLHEDGLEVGPLVPEDLRDPEAIKKRVLASTDAVGNLISTDGKAAALLVFLVHESRENATDLRRQRLQSIRSVVDDNWAGVSHLGGAPFIEEAAAQASRTDIERLSPIVIGVLVVVSALLLGSLTAAGLNLLITGLGVALVMGAHGRFDEPLTIVSSSIPVMMVALGGAFGVHILAGFQRQTGATSRERASKTLRELWSPVQLSGITTAVAFFALLVMPQVPMQRFGIVAGLGVLVLLLLALFAMPAILAILPGKLITPRPERPMPFRFRPPNWALALMALAGIGLATTLRADPDTANVFVESSEPSQSNAFFNDQFGGSTFLQITIEGDLREHTVLREIQLLAEQVKAVDGVVDVRSLMDPVAVLNAAMGGRKGVPETPERAGQVLAYLIGHPAMAQLMTEEADGALIHIKLAPISGDRQVEVTAKVRELLERYAQGNDKITAAKVTHESVRAVQVAEVAARLGRLTGNQIDPAGLTGTTVKPTPELEAALAKIRDKALNSEDSPVDPPPLAEIESIAPASLIEPRGEELKALLRAKLPTLVASDAEGVGFVAKYLGPWVDEELVAHRVGQRCAALGLGADTQENKGDEPSACAAYQPVLSGLDDLEWGLVVPPAGEIEGARSIEFRPRLTGQPVIGKAFADSVTSSLLFSTLVSIGGLAAMLLFARKLITLVPAMWTLCMTAGLIGLLGHSISVGTSMVSCIALGAGVDFAIHLGFRARSLADAGVPDYGARAVHEIGAVIIISALQLALAFFVLLASEMTPLRHFGVGLAIGLLGAALGACWLVPRLFAKK